jgi:hypothetical protein
VLNIQRFVICGLVAKKEKALKDLIDARLDLTLCWCERGLANEKGGKCLYMATGVVPKDNPLVPW